MMICCAASWLRMRKFLAVSRCELGQICSMSKISKRKKDLQKEKAPHLIATNSNKSQIAIGNALSFFDDHYFNTFGKAKWAKARLALLTRPKHAALINNFARPDEARRFLQEQGCQSVPNIIKNEVVSDQVSVNEVDLTRYNRVEEYEEEEKESVPSLSSNEAKSRTIQPDEEIMAGSNSASALYNFTPSMQLKGLEDDFVDESDYFKDSSGDMVPIPIIKSAPIAFPKHLDLWVHPKADFSRFAQPKPAKPLGTYNYYCLDLASVIPVLALNLQPGDSVLDLCSGPGGKALAALQTLLPAEILCNDNRADRLLRVRHVMEMYLGQQHEQLQRKLKLKLDFSKADGSELHLGYANYFDRVLCDVPCFTDRHVLKIEEKNIFKKSRVKERLRLPEIQTDLLVSAIKCLKVNGSVIYSTCTMSPMQNDGVVRTALKTIWEETNLEYCVEDLSGFLGKFDEIFTVDKSKYGQLIMPNILNNFGPMYIAKITRTK